MTGSELAVGFIGLGQIGGPMAKRLTDRPGGLTVFDVSTRATGPFAEAGVRVAASPAELAEHSQVISLMVRDDAQVVEVLTGGDGILAGAREGTIVAIHSTVEAGTPERMAATAEEHGVIVIDAPVSGGMMGAHEGTLAIMIGGPHEAVEAVREAFEPIAGIIAHMGPVGAGTRAKLARNLITFVSFTAVGEALRLAEAAGVDLAQLGEVVRHSDRVTGGPGAVMLRTSGEPLAPDDGLRPIFEHTRDLGEKDLWLALDLATEVGVELPMAAHALTALAPALGVPPDPLAGVFESTEQT